MSQGVVYSHIFVSSTFRSAQLSTTQRNPTYRPSNHVPPQSTAGINNSHPLSAAIISVDKLLFSVASVISCTSCDFPRSTTPPPISYQAALLQRRRRSTRSIVTLVIFTIRSTKVHICLSARTPRRRITTSNTFHLWICNSWSLQRYSRCIRFQH